MNDCRQVLLTRQAELRARLREHEGDGRVQHAQELLAGQDAGEPSLAVEREVDVALGEQERAALIDIEAALQRLDEGRYGVCAQCGEDIAAERLKVLPQALYCIDCERHHELAQRLPAHRTL